MFFEELSYYGLVPAMIQFLRLNDSMKWANMEYRR